MARVTVEDCVTIIPNRFELVLLAAQRARDISAGLQLTVDRDNDKNAVVALREIADQTVDFEELRRHIARGVNRHEDLNQEDDDLIALMQEGLNELEQKIADDLSIDEVAFDDGAEEEAQDAAKADTDTDTTDTDDTDEEPALEDIEAVEADVSADGGEDLETPSDVKA